MSLLTNAMLIALYVVQFFASHQPCLTRSGHNITNNFVNAYGVGLILVSIDALISNVVGVYLRFKVQYEERTFGLVTTSTRRLTLSCTYMEWVLRASILSVSMI